METRHQNLLAAILEAEGLDKTLTALAVIASGKVPSTHKMEAKQWARASERIVKLRDWCALYGPGSGCK